MNKKNDPFESPEEFDEFMSEEPAGEKNEFAEEEAPAKEEPVEEGLPEELEEEMSIPEKLPEEEGRPEDMLDIAADVPVQVVAVLGKKNITIKELALLKMGEVIELGRPANEIVDLVAGGKLVAKGELVEIEGKLGVKIIKMIK